MKRRRTSLRLASAVRWQSPFLLTLAWLLIDGLSCQAQSAETPAPRPVLVAPVKQLGAPVTREAENASTNTPQRPQPTLPSGKLPQYQLDRTDDWSAGDAAAGDAELAFLLDVPARPVLVRAAVTVDGRPFPQARQRRVAEILEAVRRPQAQPELETPGAAEDAPPPHGDVVVGDPAEEQVAIEQEHTYRLAQGATEYVARYVAATGRSPEPAEIQWLLETRLDGPMLLTLHDDFQRFRARQRPVFQVLDRDRSGSLSADELQRAGQSLRDCDRNRDEIVTYSEIAQAGQDARPVSKPLIDRALIYPLGYASPAVRADLPVSILESFEQPTTVQLSAEQRQQLLAAEPDIRLLVAFSTADPGQSTISLNSVSDRLANAAASVHPSGNAIQISLPGAILAFSAVQAEASDQVSLGAVNDGYPLLPELDLNGDGRFTVRELRQLDQRLKPFDRNGDGSIAGEEMWPTIRLCFGLGPTVHRELATVRSVNRPTELADPPAWFVRMDRNRDHDLTRREFPGTDEQFKDLDADQDGLVSGQEAADFEQATRSVPAEEASESGAEQQRTNE